MFGGPKQPDQVNLSQKEEDLFMSVEILRIRKQYKLFPPFVSGLWGLSKHRDCNGDFNRPKLHRNWIEGSINICPQILNETQRQSQSPFRVSLRSPNIFFFKNEWAGRPRPAEMKSTQTEKVWSQGQFPPLFFKDSISTTC